VSPEPLTVSTPAATNQLIVVAIVLVDPTNNHTFSITDNGANAGWNQLSNQITPISAHNCAAVFWRYTTAADVASLTTIDFGYTGTASTITGGSCSADFYGGFTGTPTLDLSPTSVDNSTTGTTNTITGGVAAQSTELAISVVAASGSLGAVTGTNTYSPNNGTNTYTWNNTMSANSLIARDYALPVVAGATASKFIKTWTTTHSTAVWGATFYDPGPPPSSGSFLSFCAGSSMAMVAALATVLLTAPGIASLTNAQYATLASWGVGAIVVGSNSGGGASWPFGFGGSAAFNGSGGGATQTSLTAAAVLAHANGIKVYLGIYIQNYEWGTANTTNPAPCLGNWDPAFTDANGNGWGTQTTAGSWNKMAFDYGCAVAQMNLDGMFWDTEGGGIGVGTSPGSDFVTWCWCNHNNGYGSSSSLAQQNGWAQTAGANMMAAINAGFQSLGGNACISGNQVPIITYQSTVAGYPQLLNGYMDKYYTFTGATTTVTGLGTVSYHTAIGASTWTAFLTGVASQTTGPIVLGDSLFYGYQFVTSGGPYSADSDGGWARALTDDRNSLAALSLGSNVFISPFIWPYDNTAGNGGSGIWSQATWNQAIGPILAGCEGDTYFIFQYTPLVSGGTLVTNYADNTYNGSPNINYTPLT
jgi:hypothetical protein